VLFLKTAINTGLAKSDDKKAQKEKKLAAEAKGGEK
jgi:hypothetical protein